MFATRDAREKYGADRSYQLITASIVCLVIAVIGVVLRCSARKWALGTFALDDWLMIITLVGESRLLSKRRADYELPVDSIHYAGRIDHRNGTPRSGKAQQRTGQS